MSFHLQTPKKLNFPLSLDYLEAIEKISDHLQNLNIDKITSQINSKGINFDKSIVKEKIDQIFRNLDVIKNLYKHIVVLKKILLSTSMQ